MAEKRLSGEEQRAKMKELYKKDLRARKEFLENVKEHKRQKTLTDAVLNVTGALENDDTDVWVDQLNKESAMSEAKMEMALDSATSAPEVTEQERLAMSDAEIRKLQAAELVAKMKAEMEAAAKGPSTPEAPKEEAKPAVEAPAPPATDAESGTSAEDRPNRKLLDGI